MQASGGVLAHEAEDEGEQVRRGRATMLLEGRSKTVSFEVIAEEIDGVETGVEAGQVKHCHATGPHAPNEDRVGMLSRISRSLAPQPGQSH